MNFHLDQGIATLIVGICVLIVNIWQNHRIGEVHTLVNSNFAEAKAARLAAEEALRTSQALNVALQLRLDERKSIDGLPFNQ